MGLEAKQRPFPRRLRRLFQKDETEAPYPWGARDLFSCTRQNKAKAMLFLAFLSPPMVQSSKTKSKEPNVRTW